MVLTQFFKIYKLFYLGWSLVLVNIVSSEGARILFFIPTPSISHQLPFRPLTQELARRGHDVVVITTDPAFPKGGAPENLTEIDVHDKSYQIFKKFAEGSTGNKNDIYRHMKSCYQLANAAFETQLLNEEVQTIINDKNNTFDLILVEEWRRPALVMSHLMKNVPIISISSFGSLFGHYAELGVPMHPFLYPAILNQWTYNLTFWDKVNQLYNYLRLQHLYVSSEEEENEMLRKHFGPDVPTLSELHNNVHLYMLNSHPMWELNRPVPPNVIHIGGIHKIPEKELPKDLKKLLDSSKNGTIYMSLGTNVRPSLLPEHKIRMFTRVLSEQPYDVIWKYDGEHLPGKPDNMKIGKWFPQSDILRHPKIKLFITQGGLQSTDEAISAGVPVIGLPMLADQWYNTNNYARFKIGIKLDMDTVTEEQFREAIKRVTDDESYRKNILKLRTVMYDQPEPPLERAIWWIEYVIRHGGAKHLRGPAANMSWLEFLEIELVLFLLTCMLLFFVVFFILVNNLLRIFKSVMQRVPITIKIKKS